MPSDTVSLRICIKVSEISNWIGVIEGTKNGNVLVAIVRNQTRFEGSFALVEPGLGLTQAKVIGT